MKILCMCVNILIIF